MSVVEASFNIAAPPQAVWDVVMDPRRLRDWVTIHRSVSDFSVGAPHEGDRMTQRIALRGADFTVRWVLEECEAPRHGRWRGQGPARSVAEIDYLLEETVDGTLFTYRNEFRAPFGPLGAAAGRLLIGAVPEREARRSLERLRALVEPHRRDIR